MSRDPCGQVLSHITGLENASSVSRTKIRRVLMLFIDEILLGQKYYFYGLMQKSRLKLLFLQKINQ